jgi:ADP-heptose:LPS heptosyltransferase/lauroyl/myristoyl acyltransferase
MAILIKAIAFLMSKMPHFILGKMCQALGALMIRLPLKRKRVLLSNLVHAFPSWSKAKLSSVASESAARMFEMGFFSIIYPYFNKARRWSTVFYDQQTLRELDDLRKDDVPVLFLVPHVSLFETLATSPFFRPNKGKSLGAVYRPNRNSKLDDWITKARLSTGMKLFSRKAGLKKALYFLRDGNWLTVLFDQNGGHAGSNGMFLERLTSITTFPDLLAKVNNLRVVYALPRRIGFFKTHLVLKEIHTIKDKPISIQAHDLLATDIKKCNRALPEWLWAHGKWKVHYYPEVRFQLNQKRSFLSKDESVRTGTRVVIRLSNWLGDVVMSLPIIRALRNARPDMQFLIMGRSIFLPLLKEFELGEEFIETDQKNLKNHLNVLLEARSKLPECHLLFTNSLRGDTESLIIGSPQRFGLKISGKKRPFLTNTLCVKIAEFHSQHLTKTWEKMIRGFGFLGNVSYEPFVLSNFGRVQTTSLKIGIALGSSNNPAKQWPVNNWIHLIQLLGEHESNIKVVLYGTKSDFGLSSQILNQDCLRDIENLVGQTSIVQLAEGFSACSLVIGCDSGAVHLASAVGTPTLTIFGPTNHTVTSPCFNNIKRELVSASPSHSMRDWCPTEVFEQYKKLVSLVRN